MPPATRSSFSLVLNNEIDKTSFDSLPNEILTHILETGYLSVRNESGAFRTMTSQVNRRWRECVIHTPALWTILDISMAQPVGSTLQFLTLALERSRDHPLDLLLDFSSIDEEASHVIDKILPHSPRWERVDISLVASRSALTFLTRIPVPNLTHLSISASQQIGPALLFDPGVIPPLSILALNNIDLSATHLPFPNLTILKLGRVMLGPSSFDALNGSTSLKQFEIQLDSQSLLHFDTGPQSAVIQLPGLQSVLIMVTASAKACIAPFLGRFTFPGILSLTVNQEHGSPYLQYTAPSLGKALQHPAGIDHGKLYIRKVQPFLLTHQPPITTLDLHDIDWPAYPESVLVNIFAAMTTLENLSISKLRARDTRCLTSYRAPEDTRPFSLPSLRRLHIAMKVDDHGNLQDGAQNRLPGSLASAVDRLSQIAEALATFALSCFVRMLMRPTLQSLALSNLRLEEWTSLVNALIKHGHDCALLHSLEIANIEDIIPPHIPFADAFPHITHLVLHKVTTNSFIRHLVVNEVDSTVSIRCPSLRHLSIYCDDLASRRLLHKVVDTRRSAGCPITKLKLDSYFACNADSWDWLSQNVEGVFAAGICSKHNSQFSYTSGN